MTRNIFTSKYNAWWINCELVLDIRFFQHNNNNKFFHSYDMKKYNLGTLTFFIRLYSSVLTHKQSANLFFIKLQITLPAEKVLREELTPQSKIPGHFDRFSFRGYGVFGLKSDPGS